MPEHITARKTYVGIWITLMVLTLVTALLSFQDLGIFSAPVALFIATIKALLVVLFFMHVRQSPKIISLVIVAGLFWLMILISLTMTDYASRHWLAYPGQ